MNKTELTSLAKSMKLPKTWKVLNVYPKHLGKKEVNETDYIILGQPVEEYLMEDIINQDKLIDKLLRHLNKWEKSNEAKWCEFGTGYFFGGEYYEIKLVRKLM